jgi:hypothetical protein
MSDLSEARTALQRASDRVERQDHEQLLSVDEGLAELVEGEKTSDAGPHLDNLRELEQKLSGLEDEIDDDVASDHVATARERIAEHRDERAREEADDGE